MKTKHTPGPWTAIIHDDGVIYVTGPHAGGGDICDLYHGRHTKFTKENAANNAILIAAAPTMLDALIDVVHQVEAGVEPIDIDGVWRAIREATRGAE